MVGDNCIHITDKQNFNNNGDVEIQNKISSVRMRWKHDILAIYTQKNLNITTNVQSKCCTTNDAGK